MGRSHRADDGKLFGVSSSLLGGAKELSTLIGEDVNYFMVDST